MLVTMFEIYSDHNMIIDTLYKYHNYCTFFFLIINIKCMYNHTVVPVVINDVEW